VGTRTRQLAAAARTISKGELARYSGRSIGQTIRFETLLAAHTGSAHARAVNSGTSALTCSLAALGVGPGDEVLVPAYTWVSSAAAAVMVGAVPILVEIDQSLTMDPVDLEAKITPRTKAIIPVHMLNLPADMDTIVEIAARHQLVVLEDACQAVGVTYKGRQLGSIGQMGAFSFNDHKNIRAGEGGAFITNRTDLYERGSMFHDVGSYQRRGVDLSETAFVGLNLRANELSSAILIPQLKALERQMRARARRTAVLSDALGRRDDLTVSPHNSPADAVSLSVNFDDPEKAKRFADAATGVTRLIDTGRHVYSNWQSILARRTFDDRVNPWADCDIDYVGSCPGTTRILERTCSVSTRPDLPMPVVWKLARDYSRLSV